MKLNAVPSSIEFWHYVPQCVSPSLVQSSPCSTNKCQRDRNCLFGPSRYLMRYGSLNQTLSIARAITRSCSLDKIFHEDGRLVKRFGARNGGENNGGHGRNKQYCKMSETSFFGHRHGMDAKLFSPSQFHFSEPMMLGIRPDPPEWPECETVTNAIIEHKANSVDLPVSLRMIKKKLQREEIDTDSDSRESVAVRKAFSSMVSIIVELQSHALHMRQEICHEDLEIIADKVQNEMHSSFVWLFQQVLSRTPSLMISLMVLLANFSVYSASHDVSFTETSFRGAPYGLYVEGKQNRRPPQIVSSVDTIPVKKDSSSLGPIGKNLQISNSPSGTEQDLRTEEEMNLWDSMVEKATNMQVDLKDKVLDHNTMKHFVSPVSVELEPDDYEVYLRTDLFYQMNLSREPNNPLLLCNYAQYLHLVTRDYARAEECYKRAVQVWPPDAESLNQYANFLWTVRGDFWGAEERFLQALAAQPENSYYASRYANFLWSTGGEETCFPLDNSHSSSISSNT